MFHLTKETRHAAETELDNLPIGRVFYIRAEHMIVVVPTNETGIHTGRRRFLVACISCAALLHEATTGPLERIEDHPFPGRGIT